MIGVRRQVEEKIRLERIFKPEVRRIFNQQIKDFRVSVAATSLPPRIDAYKAVWEVALKNHFRRVQKAFIGAVKQMDEDWLLKIFLDWNNKFAPQDADWINKTTQDQMNKVITEAMEEAAIELRAAVDSRTLSANATAKLRRQLRNRIDRIVNTETQKAAESAKFMEAEVHSGIKPRILGGSLQETNTTKRWVTVGDKFVRDIHKLANGQTRKLHEPYIVGGEYLMHPGDSSLGASIGNLANCRCVSAYKFY